jgi:enamine deaminase RidA (YjgF/YER057c/UK114 family)
MSAAKPIHPAGWMKPSGYAHAMSADGRVIAIAGQVGWNPKNGVIESDDFAAQSGQALRNIVDALKAAGAGPEHLVRLTWFITSKAEYMRSREALGVAYRAIIGSNYPAMSVVVVAGLLEDGAKVEIEATAVMGDG